MKSKPLSQRCLTSILTATIWLMGLASVQGDDDLYSFDVESFTKKTWEWSGTVTATGTARSYRSDSAFYPVRFPADSPSNATEAELSLTLDSRWDWDWSRLFVSGIGRYFDSSLPDSNQNVALLTEAYWQLATFEPHSIEIGKRLLRWGKGYAFNPVALLERPKNPEDPEAAREGLWMARGTWITGSFGPLDNSSVTLVGMPLSEEINDDFRVGAVAESVTGLKLYGLIGTTDIDLYWVEWPQSRITDRGIDFAANLTAFFAVHGELNVRETVTGDIQTTMLGLRYLTASEVTWIAELYQDSAGMTAKESEAVFSAIDRLSPTAARPYLSQIQQRRTINQHYGYLKASVKEPFDWLYFTPAITWLGNLDDGSATATLQLAYAPGTNWAVNTAWQVLAGPPDTQYGESLTDSKLVIEVHHSF
jgi:hypothetical protein